MHAQLALAVLVPAANPNPASRRQKPRSLTVVDSGSSPYAPGALRASTDREHERVVRFTREHPEYERALGYEGLKQVAAGYLDDEDLAVRGELRAAGVQLGFRRVESDDVNPAWSDEQ